MIKYYKVTNLHLYSAIINTDLHMIRYEINSWASPKQGHGPLFIFDNLEEAKDFGVSPYFRIFECEIEQKLESYTNFIKEWNKHEFERPTVFASAVKLLKEIT